MRIERFKTRCQPFGVVLHVVAWAHNKVHRALTLAQNGRARLQIILNGAHNRCSGAALLLPDRKIRVASRSVRRSTRWTSRWL